MATYYMDTAGSNTAPYDTWIKAATSIQTVLDLAVVADIIYCRGTETYAAAVTIDIDTNSGTNAGGWIKVIGCNAAGNVDGTRFTLNVNSQACHGLTVGGGVDMVWMENIEIKNAGAGGDSKDGINVAATGSAGWVFLNCSFHNNSGNGFNTGTQTYFSPAYFIRCTSYLNTLNGFAPGTVNKFFFCSTYSNTGDGFTSCRDMLFGCIAHDNSDDGLDVFASAGIPIINCVSDGNTDDGINLQSGTGLSANIILGTRITNHSGVGDIGLQCGADPQIVGWCYFEDNTDNIADTAPLFQFIPLEGGSATSNLEDLANTNEGYVDDATHDFSTGYTDAGDPDLRRVAITVPWT